MGMNAEVSHAYNPNPLQALGFTETESLVYGYLVENSPATGYRISHAIGKQPANTYRALRSLEDKGAIIVEAGQSKLCQAVPPEELLAGLERQFQNHRLEAKRELEALPSPSAYGGVFHLKSVEQVIARAQVMVREAKEIVLCDLSPGPCEKLTETLRESAASGVLVACHVYAGEEIPGVHTLHITGLALESVGWPGQQISVVADSLEHLLGLLSRDMESVHEAVWSNSTFLSCMQHNHLLADIIASGPRSSYSGPAEDIDEVLDAIMLSQLRPPGLRKLIERCGFGNSTEKRKIDRRGNSTVNGTE